MYDTERKVLHVDDDPDMTRLVGSLLKPHGIQTFPLNDPAASISQLVKGTHRVVLLDVDMGAYNGLDVLAKIKQFDGGIQVVMLTGVVTMTTVLKSFELGAEACLFKPIDDRGEALVRVLRDTFRKIDRWWKTLEELKARSHVCEPPLGTPT